MGNLFTNPAAEQSDDESEYHSCTEEIINENHYKEITDVKTPTTPVQLGDNLLNKNVENKTLPVTSFDTSLFAEFTPPDVEPSFVGMDEDSSSDSELTTSEPVSSETENVMLDSEWNQTSLSEAPVSEEQIQVIICNSNACGDGPNTQILLTTEDMQVDLKDDQKRETSAISWEINFNQSEASKKPPKDLRERLSSKKTLSQRKKDYQKFKDNSLPIMTSVITQRKVFDLKRWHCMSRPQYKRSCGISSVVSIWNYLYSNIGTGNLPPITQEEALHILGFKPPFGEIKFGAFTGNATLLRWFRRLNDVFGVYGKAQYLYKPKGRFQTKAMTDENALKSLQDGLKSDTTAFIYHCLNHYFCPIGYEDTPQRASAAYSGKDYQTDDNDSEVLNFETWMFIGEPSVKHPPLHCKRWTEILQDLHMESPSYYDIRRPENGIQLRKTKKMGGNLHCLLQFKKMDQKLKHKKL